MEWLKSIDFYSAKVIVVIVAYPIIGFIISRVDWYRILLTYRDRLAKAKSEFLKSKGLSVESVPASLQAEWDECCRKAEFGKPAPESFLYMTLWPVMVVVGIIYCLVVWPAKRLWNWFVDFDVWIEKKAMAGVSDDLPTEAEREKQQKIFEAERDKRDKLAREAALRIFKNEDKAVGSKDEKTIGPDLRGFK